MTRRQWIGIMSVVTVAWVAGLAGCTPPTTSPAPSSTSAPVPSPSTSAPATSVTPTPSSTVAPTESPSPTDLGQSPDDSVVQVLTDVPDVTAVDTIATTPVVVLDEAGRGHSAALASVQRFADDLAAGDLDHLIAACWTRVPAELRAAFGTLAQRQAALAAFATPGYETETGVGWGPGVSGDLFFNREELLSSYACPFPSAYTPSGAQLVLGRLVARHQGTANLATPSRPASSSEAMNRNPVVTGSPVNSPTGH